jgi:hypothetical protein
MLGYIQESWYTSLENHEKEYKGGWSQSPYLTRHHSITKHSTITLGWRSGRGLFEGKVPVFANYRGVSPTTDQPHKLIQFVESRQHEQTVGMLLISSKLFYAATEWSKSLCTPGDCNTESYN